SSLSYASHPLNPTTTLVQTPTLHKPIYDIDEANVNWSSTVSLLHFARRTTLLKGKRINVSVKVIFEQILY
ncbi:MAG: hypothetical protein ACRDL7_16440, partial [Gaiellaceae bacterium]